MFIYMLVGLASFALGWGLRIVYVDFKQNRTFNLIADGIHNFERGEREIQNMQEFHGLLLNDPMRKFLRVIFHKMVELALTKEDVDVLQKTGYWMNIWFGLPSDHPTHILFDQRILQKASLPHRPDPSIPKTRIAGSRAGI